MGNLLPVLVAYLLNGCGIYLFIDPKLNGCGPYLSMLIFDTAVFLLLCDIRLYPTSMRKLGTCCSNIMQFVIAALIVEHLVVDFWLPLEEDVMHLLPKIAEVEEELLRQGGFECETITEFLKKEETQIAASYALSLFFILCVFHATRIVDFRLLRCSPKVFFQDLIVRSKAVFRKAYKSVGGCGRKCVKWNSTKEEEDDEYCNMDDECLAAAFQQCPSLRNRPGRRPSSRRCRQ